MPAIQLTLLNSMAGHEFEPALDTHVAWGVALLDLKDRIYGKAIAELTLDEARRAAGQIAERELKVYAFSTHLFGSEVEEGEVAFTKRNLHPLAHVLDLARILKPTFIRLLGAQTRRRKDLPDAVAYLQAEQPWVLPAYRQAVDEIHGAGFRCCIENEVGGTIFSSVREVRSFFEALDRRKAARFTWDIQNFWQLGVFPSLEVYHELKEWIGFVHLKGGQTEPPGTPGVPLRWRAGLADASWPVREIMGQVLADGVSPVWCVNPSHGEAKPGYDYQGLYRRDLEFLRKTFPGVA